jgi:hypothetical protein
MTTYRRFTSLRDRLALFATVTTLAMAAASPVSAAGLNDEPETARAVVSLPFTEVVDVSAASDDDGTWSSSCGQVDRTVWYRVELSQGTDVRIDTSGSTYDTVLDVYSEVGAEIACVDDTAASQQAQLAFTVHPGAAYYVRVGRRITDGPVGEPAGLLPAAEDDEPTVLQLTMERTRIRSSGPPTRGTDWRRGGSAFVEQVLIDEPGEWRSQGFIIDAGHSDERVHDDLDLSWRHYRIDHDKQVLLMEDWDAKGSPGWATVDRRLDGAEARGQLWHQGLLCTYALGDGETDELVALEDEEPSEVEDCHSLGGEWVEVDVTFTGVGPLDRISQVERMRTPHFHEVILDQGIARAAVATGRIGGDLNPYRVEGADGYMVYGVYRSMVWGPPSSDRTALGRS